jgi:hypothetical protein
MQTKGLAYASPFVFILKIYSTVAGLDDLAAPFSVDLLSFFSTFSDFSVFAALSVVPEDSLFPFLLSFSPAGFKVEERALESVT